jgi:hypothetical protein
MNKLLLISSFVISLTALLAQANTQGHYAVRGTRNYLLGNKNIILQTYLSEIDEL